MKYSTFVFIFIIVSCSSTKTLSLINTDEESLSFKIHKIKDEKTFHIIYAERNDSIFQIFSDKTIALPNKCEEIKKGQCYSLKLKKILPPDSLLGMPYHYNIGIKTTWDKYIKEKYHYTVYKSENLNGLCLIEENKEQFELEAIGYQKSTLEFEKTTREYKETIDRYESYWKERESD